MPLNKDLREFVELLNSNRAIRRACSKLFTQFGFGALGITAAALTAVGQVVQLAVKPNRIDILTSVSGVGFEEAWQPSSGASR